MSYHFPTLHLACDGGTKKKPCGQELTVENPDELAAVILFHIAREKGWHAPAGGGSTLCPGHLRETEAKYKIKLAKEAKEKQAKGAGI